MLTPIEITISEDEAAMATLSYEQWERSEAESMAEYTHRRRTVDLSILVEDVIQNELSDKERQAIRLVFFERLTPQEAIRHTTWSTPTFYRTLENAEKKIRHYLQYAVQYQYNLRNVTFLPLAVREAMVTAAARTCNVRNLADSLKSLRQGENIALPALSRAVSIPVPRLERLESGEALPDAEEILHLAAFYGVSTDKLLKGEDNGTDIKRTGGTVRTERIPHDGTDSQI